MRERCTYLTMIMKLLPVFGPLIGALVGGLLTLLGQSFHAERGAKIIRKERAATRNFLLCIFCKEAVYLHSRWTDYYNQSIRGELSRSLPFEVTTSETLSELINVSSPADVELLLAIIKLKEINHQVLNQMRVDQNEHLANRTVQFRAVPFIRDTWASASEATQCLLDSVPDILPNLSTEFDKNASLFEDICIRDAFLKLRKERNGKPITVRY